MISNITQFACIDIDHAYDTMFFYGHIMLIVVDSNRKSENKLQKHCKKTEQNYPTKDESRFHRKKKWKAVFIKKKVASGKKEKKKWKVESRFHRKKKRMRTTCQYSDSLE